MTEIFRTVLNMSITGAYIAAAVMVLRLFMKRLPRKFSYMLWIILGIRLLCPFSISSAVSLFNAVNPEKTEISSGQMLYIPDEIEYAENAEITAAVPLEGTAADTSPAIEPMSVISVIWAAGVATMAVYTVISCVSVKRRVSGARCLAGNIFFCKNIETPFVFGVVKPKIYIPEDISQADMPYITAHERTHIKRGDHIAKLFAMAALCIHWFNPMVWLSYCLMTADMELSCDEKALGSFDAEVKKAYANALLNISLKQNRLTLGGVLGFGESNIKSRIKGVLSAKKPKLAATAAAVIALIAAAGCLLTNAVGKNGYEPIPEGDYVTEKLLYTSPLKSSFWGDDNGLLYTIKDGSLTVSSGGEELRRYRLSEPTDIPFTEEEWDAPYAEYGDLGWQDGVKHLDDYSVKYCTALHSDADGGLSLYLFQMDNELWLVSHGWEIYRLKAVDGSALGRKYTYVSDPADLEAAMKFERVIGRDMLCMNIDIPYSAEAGDGFAKLSDGTVMRVSPFIEGSVDMEAVSAFSRAEMERQQLSYGENISETADGKRFLEYRIDGSGAVWYCFAVQLNDRYTVIIRFETDSGFSAETAEEIVSTAVFMGNFEIPEAAETNIEAEAHPKHKSPDEAVVYKREMLIERVCYPTKAGDFILDKDSPAIRVDFMIPEDWTGEERIYSAGGREVMQQQPVYPEAAGADESGLKDGFVVIDEKYGDESDPYFYYLHRALENGDMESHCFIVHYNGYYVNFLFEENEDFNMTIAEEVLTTVMVTPVYRDSDGKPMKAVMTVVPQGELQPDGTVSDTGETAEVKCFLPEAWVVERVNALSFDKYGYNEDIFSIEGVYPADGKDGDVIERKTVGGSEQYTVIKDGYAVIVRFNAGYSDEAIRMTVLDSIGFGVYL